MLKQDITQKTLEYQEGKQAAIRLQKLNKPKKSKILLDKLKESYKVIHFSNVALMVITMVLQMLLGGGVVHLILCSVITAVSLFLFFISGKYNSNRKHHIVVAVLWGLNAAMALVRVIFGY